MMLISCFRKSYGMLLILVLLLLPPSCVTTKDVKTADKKIPSATHSTKDMPAPVEIKPKTPQTVNLPEKGPLKITVKDAILIALENNRSLVVERLNPSIRQTFEDQERAVFDPTVEAGVSSTRLGISVTQSLLRGYGTDVNLARLRQSRLETDITQYELRGFSESLLAQVETTYWDYALSQRQIEIVEESLKLAKQQIAETEEMIRVGVMAEAELAAVQAEVAAQQQGREVQWSLPGSGCSGC